MDELLDQPVEWPCFAGRRILIIGVGGGCDILVAYALATLFRAHAAAEVVYATTKSEVLPGVQRVSAHVYRLSDRTKRSSGAGLGAALRIEDLVPRGDRDCPLIFHIPRGPEHSELVAEIRLLGFDGVISVDTGGDSLIESALSGPDGRDKRMLRVLRATGLPLIHVVVAPGSDGEATADEIAACFRELRTQQCYRGCFDLRPLVPLLGELAARLTPERTPNIIAAAAAQGCADPGDVVEIPRGLHPLIPCEWLLRGFALAWQPWR